MNFKNERNGGDSEKIGATVEDEGCRKNCHPLCASRHIPNRDAQRRYVSAQNRGRNRRKGSACAWSCIRGERPGISRRLRRADRSHSQALHEHDPPLCPGTAISKDVPSRIFAVVFGSDSRPGENDAMTVALLFFGLFAAGVEAEEARRAAVSPRLPDRSRGWPLELRRGMMGNHACSHLDPAAVSER